MPTGGGGGGGVSGQAGETREGGRAGGSVLQLSVAGVVGLI